MEQIDPNAATYFTSPDEAAQAMVGALEQLAALAEVDEKAYFLAQALGNVTDPVTGERTLDPEQIIQVDPMTGQAEVNLPDGVSVVPVTVEHVWRDTSGISPEELVREMTYEIATGTMQKFNKDREIDLAEQWVNQVLPVAVQAGDYQLINAIFHFVYEAHEVPMDHRLPPLQPPPPPPEEVQGDDKS